MGEPARQSRRYTVEQRSSFIVVIDFKNLEWKDHLAKIVDISRTGVGIETAEKLESGFVWFRDRVGGFRGGVMMWCKQTGQKHRAGIRFVPLSIIEETTIRQQLEQARIHKPLQIPERIISTIMASMTKVSGEGYLDASELLGDLDAETDKER
ncbi:MAG: PilZ domain-containing protein [Nitrospiraceae bacterium]|nr:PilZ domain-containing protein [Nitrospiraceae bacterium]